MENQWIKDLVIAEQEREQSGLVDISPETEVQRVMTLETHEFLEDMKIAFVKTASSFNELKDSSLGSLKVYGIARTKADFMLFRNGYKLIFFFKHPGQIFISFQHITTTFKAPVNHNEKEGGETTTTTSSTNNETILTAQWGAFGHLNWSYQGHPIKIDALVKYYLSQFIRESGQ